MRRVAPLLGAFLLASVFAFSIAQRSRSTGAPDASPQMTQPSGPACLLHAVGRHLDLNTEQSRRVDQLDSQFQKDRLALRVQMLEKRRDLFRLLAAKEPDQAAIAARADEIASLQAALQRRIIRYLLAIKEVLNAEQQAKLFTLLGSSMGMREGGMGLCDREEKSSHVP